jgi:L-asparagine transporter-like permease
VDRQHWHTLIIFEKIAQRITCRFTMAGASKWTQWKTSLAVLCVPTMLKIKVYCNFDFCFDRFHHFYMITMIKIQMLCKSCKSI